MAASLTMIILDTDLAMGAPGSPERMAALR